MNFDKKRYKLLTKDISYSPLPQELFSLPQACRLAAASELQSGLNA
jgi:hypothetical protein